MTEKIETTTLNYRHDVERLEAQVVHERHSGFDDRTGPWEADRVGARIGDRVFWVASGCWPGDNPTFEADAALAAEIVLRWNSGGQP